jgi:Polysaccharide lyase
VNAAASRPLAFFSTALLVVLVVLPAPASASHGHRRHLHGVRHTGIGVARIVKRARVQRARASRREAAPKPNAAAASAENPGVLFRGDFDSGFTGWHVQSLSYRATLFSTGAYQGIQAARFEVQPGDVEPETGSQRSEVSGPTFEEGEDVYVRDAIRVPAANTYSAPWQIVQQWHEEDWNGSPGLAVFLEDNRALRLGPGDSSHTFWKSAPLQTDRWYDLVYRMDLSQDPSVGFVEVWLDGVQQSLANGQARAYGRTIQMPATYLKAGIYRSKSSTGTSIVEHDAIVVGTSYSAVMSG